MLTEASTLQREITEHYTVLALCTLIRSQEIKDKVVEKVEKLSGGKYNNPEIISHYINQISKNILHEENKR